MLYGPRGMRGKKQGLSSTENMAGNSIENNVRFYCIPYSRHRFPVLSFYKFDLVWKTKFFIKRFMIYNIIWYSFFFYQSSGSDSWNLFRWIFPSDVKIPHPSFSGILRFFLNFRKFERPLRNWGGFDMAASRVRPNEVCFVSVLWGSTSVRLFNLFDAVWHVFTFSESTWH